VALCAFGGRVFTKDDDQSSAPPVVVISHHTWQTVYGSDPTVVGATFVIESHPFVVVGVAPAGFFGDTLRSNPPDVWIPLQQEPLINGSGGLLRQPTAAWLRAIGRVRPGASVAAVGPRLTAVLHQWLEHDSGYPANWMPDVMRRMPQQVIAIVRGGAGVGVMKEQYSESLEILLAVCGLVLLIASPTSRTSLARAVARRAQTSIRLAVGATRDT
jgi:hypothetical protein